MQDQELLELAEKKYITCSKSKDKCLEILDIYSKIQDPDIKPYDRIAYIYLLIGDEKTAEEMYKLGISKNNKSCYSRLAYFYDNRKNSKEALDTLIKGILDCDGESVHSLERIVFSECEYFDILYRLYIENKDNTKIREFLEKYLKKFYGVVKYEIIKQYYDDGGLDGDCINCGSVNISLLLVGCGHYFCKSCYLKMCKCILCDLE